jgi:hypothetical protein
MVLRQWRLWVGLVVSVGFLYLALRGIDALSLWQALQRASYWYIVPSLIAYFTGVYIRALRWGYILSPGSPLPASRLFPVVVIGYMANDLLPARMGELVRTYVAGSRLSVSRSQAIVTIVVERLFDGITMLAFAGIALLLIPAGATLQRGLAAALLLFSAGTVSLVVAHKFRIPLLRFAALILTLLPSNLGDRIQRPLASAMEGLNILGSPSALGVALGTSILAWLCEAAMYALVAQGFGVAVSPIAYLMLVAVANLATLIPASPGYVGTFEAAALAILVPLLGVPRDLAAAYVLVLHAALYFPVTALGLIYWWRNSLSMKAVMSSSPLEGERHAR